jgi:hypothetical protein
MITDKDREDAERLFPDDYIEYLSDRNEDRREGYLSACEVKNKYMEERDKLLSRFLREGTEEIFKSSPEGRTTLHLADGTRLYLVEAWLDFQHKNKLE